MSITKLSNSLRPLVGRSFALPAFAALAGSALTALASPDYAPAIWNPNCNNFSTGGNGHRFLVIHDMEGYYLSSISYFKNCSTTSSIHYCVNGKQDAGSDAPAGEITQMTREAYYAYHVRCWNLYCAGTEHEGFAANPAWFTEAMYQASSALQRHLADHFGIAKDRNHIVAHGQKSVPGWTTWASANLGINPTCNTHTDPGPSWDWNHFMSLINNGSMVGGAILTKYNALGGAGSFLGQPTTYETGTPDGVGRFNHFQGGSIYWTPNYGAWSIHGAIQDHWSALGWERSVIGYPVTDETGTPDGIGRYNHFKTLAGVNGSIYYTASTGAHEVHGSIRDEWQATGWEGGRLGYPTTDETGTPDGIGRYNHFTKGSIYYSGATGAHMVVNAIHTLWAALGWEAGICGYPTTDETGTPDGIGAYNHFSKGCSIYWSPSTGAHQVGGSIQTLWSSLGWEQSWLGYPTSDEYAITGGRRSDFQHGYITYDTASGITAAGPLPSGAPSGLGATPVSSTVINLAWTDGSTNETGFKVERGTAVAGPFTTVGSTAANVLTFSSTGLTPAVTYYYRVTAYTPAGNSAYSSVVSAATQLVPPAMSVIANQTVGLNNTVAFTVTSTDPNHSATTTVWQDFESFTNNTPNDTILFRRPVNSGSTSAFLDTSTNYTCVTTSFPAGHTSAKVMKVGWGFKTGQTNPWIRLNTAASATMPNPTIDGAQDLRFDIYSTVALKVGLGFRETGTAVAYGANGGTTGTIDWAAVTNVVTGNPQASKQIAAATWTTLDINIPFEAQAAFTGNGSIDLAKGVLEHLVLGAVNNTGGAYTVYLDNFAVVGQNTLNYSLDAGAPAGASINAKNGKFTWTPVSGQAGNWSITARVTDQLGAQDFKTFKVTVTSTGNNPPVLAAIGSKTVNELTTLSFTAAATDPDAGQVLTYSLDVGAPAGASINSSTGAFSWTPVESQGPGTYPITVRVTDNGSPSSNDWETISVVVNEVNSAPVISTIGNQTVNEGSTVSLTVVATDSDIPANTLTYSLSTDAPAGSTINSSTGAFSWTPTEAQGPSTNVITVIVSDSGSPSLATTNTFTVTVNEVNTAPVLTVNTTLTTIDMISDFESYPDNSYDGTVLFRQPSFSGTTTNYIDTAATNFTSVVPIFPAGHSSFHVLQSTWSFKTGTTNPWVRLSTFNTAALPNPTVKLDQRVRFDIYTDKAVQLALGVRETGTSAIVGQDGGSTGTIEWVGATGVSGTAPVPTRTITASNWTTVEFNLPAESITAFPGSGNGVLATGRGVLEHLALVPAGGMGQYNVYVDNIEVATVTTNLTVDDGATLTVTNTATDADLPAQNLTFSLDAGAPAGATIDASTGILTWTPDATQAPSTNVITIRVTDNGAGTLSNAKSITVIVNKVNTAPILSGVPDSAIGVIELNSGQSLTFTATATDNDIPTNTLTFSLQGTVPPGATINSTSGAFSWTPTNVLSTNVITVRVTDNGVPPLYSEASVTIVVAPSNTPPVLSLGTARAEEQMATFETFTNNTPNDTVMFRRPSNSSTTTNFVSTSATNFSTITTSFPTGHTSAKVLKAGWSFATGTSNYWVRLTTANTAALPNPTIDLTQRVKFDIYTDKALLVGLGVRETGTSAAIGDNGGTTGTIEFVGCTNKINGTPMPNRLVPANTWTTLEFNLPSEPIQTFTGDGILAGGKGVLEHLILVGQGGTGAYNVYLDNVDVVTTTSLPGTVTMSANSTLTFTASGTDPDPGSGLSFGLDADAPVGSVIDAVTGAFSWTPTTGGTTNAMTVFVNDNPTNGGIQKSDSKTLTVIVNADAFAAQSASGFVSGGDTVALTWDAVVGQSYQVQYKANGSAVWINVGAVVIADSTAGSAVVNNDADGVYRVVAAGAAAEE